MPRCSTARKRSASQVSSKLVIALVALAVGVSAGLFGGVSAWWHPLLIVTASVLAITAILGCRGSGLLRPATPLASFAILVALQLVPLPFSVVDLLSPARAATLLDSLQSEPATLSLSYYPPSTFAGLTHLLTGTSVFAAVATTLRAATAIKSLFLAIFSIGVAEAGLALAQIATDATGVYWQAELSVGPGFTGSFLNHSNFSQFINLSIGAGLGLLLMQASEDRRRHPQLQLRGFGICAYKHVVVLLGIGIQVVAIAASLSRGGVLGMLVGAVLVAIILGRERSLGPRAWALLVVPLLAFAGLTIVGFDTVYDRLGTLHEHESYADRWELTKATLRSGLDHWLVGTGLDTHRYVFPAYDTTGSLALAEQADNDWAQLFEEMGIVGFALVLGFLGTVIWAGWQVVSQGKGPARYAVYGTFYALAACAVQSFSDFGQRLPAVFCSSAAMCGVVFAAAAAEVQQIEPRRTVSPVRWAIAAAVAALVGTMAYQAWLDYRAERWWSIAYAKELTLRDNDWVASPEEYIDMLAAAERASTLRPTDVEFAFWLNAYRWQAATVGIDPAVYVASNTGEAVARRLVQELGEVKRLCPTFGPTHTLEGQLLLLLGDPKGVAAVERGVTLAPNNPTACFAAAAAASSHDLPDRERAAELLTRCVHLGRGYFPEVAALWIGIYGDVSLPEELANGDVGRLDQLAGLLEGQGPFAADVERFRAEADRLKSELVASGEASAGQQAAMAAKKASEGDSEAAIRLYRHALASDHANVAWRLALCDELASLERYEQAYREARICFRLRPGWAPAKERLERLSLLIKPK